MIHSILTQLRSSVNDNEKPATDHGDTFGKSLFETTADSSLHNTLLRARIETRQECIRH